MVVCYVFRHRRAATATRSPATHTAHGACGSAMRCPALPGWPGERPRAWVMESSPGVSLSRRVLVCRGMFCCLLRRRHLTRVWEAPRGACACAGGADTRSAHQTRACVAPGHVEHRGVFARRVLALSVRRSHHPCNVTQPRPLQPVDRCTCRACAQPSKRDQPKCTQKWTPAKQQAVEVAWFGHRAHGTCT